VTPRRLVDLLFLPRDGRGFGFTRASQVGLIGYIASWVLVGQAVTEALGPTALEGEGGRLPGPHRPGP
jgi:hypothetical protein